MSLLDRECQCEEKHTVDLKGLATRTLKPMPTGCSVPQLPLKLRLQEEFLETQNKANWYVSHQKASAWGVIRYEDKHSSISVFVGKGKRQGITRACQTCTDSVCGLNIAQRQYIHLNRSWAHMPDSWSCTNTTRRSNVSSETIALDDDELVSSSVRVRDAHRTLAGERHGVRAVYASQKGHLDLKEELVARCVM